MSFIKPEQCEGSKADIFGSVFVIMRINVNGQNGCFSHGFCLKTEQCERVASMHQKRIIMKPEKCERGPIEKVCYSDIVLKVEKVPN